MLLEISRSLRNLIASSFPEIPGDWIEIVSAVDAAELPAEKLALLLYAVQEDPNMRPEFQAVVESAGQGPPLAVNLNYMIAFNSADHEEAQRRLSRVLEVIHANPVIESDILDPGLAGRVDRLTVLLHYPTVEVITRLWSGLNSGMRLALYCEVSAALA
jgi:hypothetical protein